MEHQLATKSIQKEQAKKASSSSTFQQSLPNGTMTHPVLRLQRAIGNQAVQRMANGRQLDRQTQQPSPSFQMKAASSQEGGELDRELISRIETSKGSGDPLPKNLQTSLEQSFGHNFANVRIHRNEEADSLNQSVNALAFTTGNDIYFRKGMYQPESNSGRHLLAHELAHVVQQSATNGVEPGQVGSANDSHEQEAEAAAIGCSFTEPSATASSLLTSLPSSILQRQMGVGEALTGAEIAGIVIGGVQIAQSAIGQTVGGLTYQSDQLQYPKEQTRVGPDLKHIDTRAAKFFSPGVFSDNETEFILHGEFSDSYEPATDTNRVMSNVYIDLGPTTTYSQSTLSFTAKGLQTPYGTAEDPKIQFVCTGRFDPFGSGDAGYRAVLEVNQHGHVNCIHFEFTFGDGNVSQNKYTGFLLIV